MSDTVSSFDNRFGLSTDPERERLLVGERVDWSEQTGGLVRFWDGPDGGDPIDPATFRELIEKNYVDSELAQNRSPTMSTLCDNAERLADMGYHVELTGYMISPDRDDARITVTGITVRSCENGAIDNMAQAFFRDEFGNADNLTVGAERCHAWWD